MDSGALAGRRIVVTRPRDQAAPLARLIAAAGGDALLFPLLEIAPAEDRRPLEALARQLADYRLAVFVSPNAVAHALPTLLAAGDWPASLIPAAVGPGTVRALEEAGIAGCIAPRERFDSEGLLALPELAPAAVAGCRVAILRGDGGRELLADTLRQRGASVDAVTCYQRSGPAGGFASLVDAWREARLDAIVVSSSEALRYLVDGLPAEGRAYLQQTPLFVPHARIAESARALGLERVVLTAGADSGLIRGLLAYNWCA
ncbi:uroporphyrinogen-III synthase [Azonexus caeni]|uniref:uroporphyrinogen-III synthase n=1 Tax=Azonexus caeni TaxID=266126 RepID=UPI003A862281